MDDDERNLSDTSEVILSGLVDYHRDRLFHFEDRMRSRRAEDNRSSQISLASAINQMATESLHRTPESEFFKEVARLRGTGFNPQRIKVPFQFFKRDLNTSTASAGGYLIGIESDVPRDILRPWSVTISGGINVEERLSGGDVVIPRMTQSPGISWVSTETQSVSEVMPAFNQVAMSPKIGIGIINASWNFLIQADPERFIRRSLLQLAGRVIDTAVLNGSGASVQPLGILNTPGISTQSGTSLAWAGVLKMKENAAVADVEDAFITFISEPTTRSLLEGRERAAGSGFTWQDDLVANRSAFATTLMPSGTMVSGPMSGVTLGLWGDIEVQVNPFESSFFKSGVVQIRVLLAVDVGVTVPPAAFALSSSID